MPNVIDRVVAIDRCCSCGVCAGVCPNKALVMGIRKDGDLVPKQVRNCPKNCTICIEVCPFAPGVYDPRQMVTSRGKLTAPSENDNEKKTQLRYHEDTGSYINVLVGYSEKHRSKSASGGLATFCLEELLRKDKVDVVAVVGQNFTKSGVNFSFRMVESHAELNRYSGSVYQPVEISDIVHEILTGPERRFAITAVPCLCTGIRKAMAKIPKLRKAVKYILGLTCGMYQNCMYTEMLVRKSGLRIAEVNKVEYRVKSYKRPSSNYCFLASGRDGRPGPVIEYHGLPFFLGTNGYFRLNSCNFCKDVFAENADACFMDAWLPVCQSDGRGTSIVLVRNKDISNLLKEKDDGKVRVHVENISIKHVVASQAGHVRRKRYLIGMRCGHGKSDASFIERLQWWIQRRTQGRSKWAWAKFGRRYGLVAFWVMMTDLWILQKAFQYIKNAVRYKKIILAKTSNWTGGPVER